MKELALGLGQKVCEGEERVRPRSILHQARAYVLVIVVFLAAAIISEWARLSEVRAEIDKLATRTSPLLAETGELARISSELRSLSETVQGASDVAALETLRATVEDLLRDAGQVLDAGAFPADLRRNTRATFEALLTAQAKAIRARAGIARGTATALEAMEALARDIQSDQRAQLLRRIFESTTGPAQIMSGAEIDPLLTVSEMKVSISRLSMLVSGVSSAEASRLPSIRSQAIREIGVLASRISRMEPGDRKRSLASRLSVFSDVVIAQDGLLQAVSDLADASRDRSAALTDVAMLVDEITRTLGQTSLDAASRFEQAAHATKQTIGAVLRQKLLMTLILVLLVSVFAWSVVEKGLISRLAQLTWHVRRLSQGDISTPIARTAHDEVGEIEDAVERSRVTAVALTRSNEELERFAYATAHDLRSPLRAVSDLVEWTQEDFGAALPEGAQANLSMISGRVQRLSNHLTALLQYARAGQSKTRYEPFDLLDFANELRRDFLPKDTFEIDVGGSVTRFVTCPTPLKTILINLVGNAIKHHDRPGGRVALSADVIGQQIVLRVSDDGPGIAPEHHARIFELFQTLRPSEEQDSTGMGLALVEKLVQALEGTIQICSDPERERGTTFILKLPRHAAAAADAEDITGPIQRKHAA